MRKKQPEKERFFEGLPVREARGNLLVKPSRGDIQIAKRYDPENCAYAVCLKRMLQVQRVWVYTSVAYVETLDEDGNPILERYIVKNHAHAYIEKFDRGEPVSPGGFILHSPTPGATLEHKRRQSREYAHRYPDRQKHYYEAAMARARARKTKGWNPPELKHELVGTFRSGVGQVRFVGTLNGRLGTAKTIETV
jgi:hypothetical protein